MNTYIPKGANEALKKRLDKAIPVALARKEKGLPALYGNDDYDVFCYVRDELDPQRIKDTRREDDTNLGKLHAAAAERLAHYEREDANA